MWTMTLRRLLTSPISLRNHPDRPQPLLNELRPFGDGILGAPQPKGVSAVGIQVHLRRNAGVLQRDVVHERLVHVVDAVRLGLEQKRGRRVARDVNVRIEPELTAFGNPEMSWIQRHREIRTAAFRVGGIHGGVQPRLKMRADRCHEMPARGKPENSNLVRIDMPVSGVKADESYRPLRIFQRRLWFRIDVALAAGIPRRTGTRHAVLQQHTRDPLGRQPVADFGAFEIDRENLITAAGEHDDRSAGVFAVWRIDRQRGSRNVAHVNPWFAGDYLWRRRYRFAIRPRPRIRDCPRPYRHLPMSWRWLPRRRLGTQTAECHHDAERKVQERSHDGP